MNNIYSPWSCHCLTKSMLCVIIGSFFGVIIISYCGELFTVKENISLTCTVNMYLFIMCFICSGIILQ